MDFFSFAHHKKIFLLFLLSIFFFLPFQHVQAAACCTAEMQITGATAVPLKFCRLDEPSRPCQTQFQGGWICTDPKTSESTINPSQSCPTGQLVTRAQIREVPVADCATEPKCRNQSQISQLIVNCRQFDVNLSQCPSGACFIANQKCLHQQDGGICGDLRAKVDCDKSKACHWQNNQCLTSLEAGLSSQYDTENTGGLLPPCAVDGTCRDTDDLLKLALNYTKRAFSFLGVAAFVMFVYGGFVMVTSFGNPEKFKQGRGVLIAAIVGIIITMSAYLLINFVLASLGVGSEFRAL